MEAKPKPFSKLAEEIDSLGARAWKALTLPEMDAFGVTLDGIVADGMARYRQLHDRGVKGFEERHDGSRSLLMSLLRNGRVTFGTPDVISGMAVFGDPWVGQWADEYGRAFKYLATLETSAATEEPDVAVAVPSVPASDFEIIDSDKAKVHTGIASDDTLRRRIQEGLIGAFKWGPEKGGHDPRPLWFVWLGTRLADGEEIKKYLPLQATLVSPRSADAATCRSIPRHPA
ncbi:MAG TPA: hypothetical protein VHC70_12200 [Phycisphaerales bacterium]|nr:hypothetical protein [Phycisphaerales bacterium]